MKKKVVRKPGKTLVVTLTEESFETKVFETLEGLDHFHHSDGSSSCFLTFNNLENAVNAQKHIKTEYESSVKVKYAHYKIFFKMQGLEESSDYNTVKKLHIDFIEKNTNANVLFYKLYRKENNYLDCGDLTVDIKDGFDHLVKKEDGHKEFTLSEQLSGIHYRYNRRNTNSNFKFNSD